MKEDNTKYITHSYNNQVWKLNQNTHCYQSQNSDILQTKPTK